jgi:hypothetical protein
MLARAGADTMITPREMIRAYLTALGIVMQSGGKTRLADVYQKEGSDLLPAQREEKKEEFDPETIEF